jgi:hypothetical protein
MVPVWMAYDFTVGKIYVLDTTNQVIWVYSTTSLTYTGSFSISSITVGQPKIEVATNNNTLWLSDGAHTLHSINGSTGAITNHNISANMTPSSTIVDFVFLQFNNWIIVTDSGHKITSYQATTGAYAGESYNYGFQTSKFNGAGGPSTDAYAAVYPSGVLYQANPENLGESPYSLETNPTPISVTLVNFADAYVSLVIDVHGTGNYELSVWTNSTANTPLPESYRYTWPGTGAAGYLVPIWMSGHGEYVFGLDSLGNLYSMVTTTPLFTYPYVPPDFTPTLAKTFPEVCLQILPDGQFETGSTGHYIYALGQSGTIYQYDVLAVTLPAAASIAGRSSVTALGRSVRKVSASPQGGSSVTALGRSVRKVSASPQGDSSFDALALLFGQAAASPVASAAVSAQAQSFSTAEVALEGEADVTPGAFVLTVAEAISLGVSSVSATMIGDSFTRANLGGVADISTATSVLARANALASATSSVTAHPIVLEHHVPMRGGSSVLVNPGLVHVISFFRPVGNSTSSSVQVLPTIPRAQPGVTPTNVTIAAPVALNTLRRGIRNRG